MRTLLLLLLSIGSALAQPAFPPAFWAPPSGPPPVTYIFTEGFEESNTGGGIGSSTDGFDATNIISNVNGANPDYTGNILDGTQSLLSTNNEPVRFTLTNSVTASYTELWAMCHLISMTNNGGAMINFTTDGNVVQGDCTMQILLAGTAGPMRIYNGSTFAATVSNVSTNTPYYIWMHWKSDGTGDVAFSTTTTRPTGGNNYASVSGGNGTTACTRISIGTTSSGWAAIYDNVKVSATGYPTP